MRSIDERESLLPSHPTTRLQAEREHHEHIVEALGKSGSLNGMGSSEVKEEVRLVIGDTRALKRQSGQTCPMI